MISRDELKKQVEAVLQTVEEQADRLRKTLRRRLPASERAAREPDKVANLQRELATLTAAVEHLAEEVSRAQQEAESAELALYVNQERLRLSEERFALAMQGAADGLWDWNLVTDEAYFSPRWKGMLGYGEDEIVSSFETWERLLHPDDRVRAMAAVTDYLEGRSPGYQVEFRMLHRDGGHRHILARGFAVRSEEDGRPTRLVGTHVDVTDLRRTTNALADALKLNQAVTEASPSGIMVFNAAGPCVLANEAAAASIGATLEQVLEQNFRKIDSWRRSGLLEQAERALAQGGVVRHEVHTVTSFGAEVFLECKLRAFQSGGKPHLLLITEDQTLQKRAELAREQALQELERSNRELEQYAYVASHDLQEPLRMVASFTQLLAERYRGKLDEKADVYIGFAVEGATRMQALINDLLALSRVGAGEASFKPTDCGQVVADVLRDLARVTQEKRARVTVGELPVITADSSLLRQLFQNLVDNALKFHSGQPVQVAITACREEDGWAFEVQDNGIGIHPRYFDRIFNLFQRLHTREAYPGSGIGLTIARRVVERHGGRIWVQSSPGSGACFCFFIPDQPEQGDGRAKTSNSTHLS